MKFLLLSFLILNCISLSAQNGTDAPFDINKKYSVQQLKQELGILKDSLQVLHPALYRYTSRHSFDSIFRATYRQIKRPMSLSGFYAVVAPFLSKVGDIHTSAELPDDYHNYLATKGDLFPFDVRIVNRQVFIASNNSSDSTVPAGSKILSINEHPIAKVLQKMESCFSSDGFNETFKIKRVEQRFAFQYQFVYGYSEQFKLRYQEEGKQPRTKVIQAAPFYAIRENRIKNGLKYSHLKSLFPQPPYLSLSINKEKQTAILTIKWFQNDVLKSNNEHFKTFVDSAFLEIVTLGVRNLIIDIRNNGGGESENAGYLYSYLTDKPFKFLYYMETNKNTYEYDKKGGAKYSFIKNTGKYRTLDSSMAARSPQFFGLNIQQPHSGNFAGNVFVLIDGLTTSAAPQFAALVKLNRRGILVGEEAPGSLYGGSGRGYSYFGLPNTGLTIMISLYRLSMVNPGFNSRKAVCVAPDYKTNTTIIDLLNGIDIDMEVILKLIDSNE